MNPARCKQQPTSSKGEPSAAKKKKSDKEKIPGRLPGMDEFRDAALTRKCAQLLDLEKKKNEARLAHNECHLQLLDLMKEKNVQVYKHEDSGQIFQRRADEKIVHKYLKEQAQDNNGINPDSGDSEDDDDLDAVGVSEVLEGVQEIADEGSEGDAIRPAQLKRKQTGSVPV